MAENRKKSGRTSPRKPGPRVSAQQALRDSEAKSAAILENAVDAIITIDEYGTVESFNPAAERVFQYRAAEIIGRNVKLLMPSPYRDDHDEYLKRYRDTGEKHIIGIGREVQGRRKDGSAFPLDLAVAEVRVSGRRIFTGILRDITEQKRAHEQLQSMRAHLQDVLDSLPAAIVTLDPLGRVVDWNREAESLVARPLAQAVGHPLGDLLPLLAPPFSWSPEVGTVAAKRFVFANEGQPRHMEVSVYPLAGAQAGAVVRLEDMTEKVRLQELMVTTEKMISAGALAAGVAHEINNPLAVVLQGCQNVLRRISTDLPKNQEVADSIGVGFSDVVRYLDARGIKHFIEGVQEAGQRAATIVRDTLAYSRRSPLDWRPASLDQILDTSISLVRSSYDLNLHYDFRNLEVDCDYDPGLGPITCDPAKITQVTLNLIKNAAEAMAFNHWPEPHRVTVRTRSDAEDARLEVIDHGPGMSPEVKRRVFEPFFTTKGPGQGTGLGLSVSHFIVTAQHGGSISVDSEPGQGTRFVVRLPKRGRPPH